MAYLIWCSITCQIIIGCSWLTTYSVNSLSSNLIVSCIQHLRTDENGIATFKGIPFTTSAGPCRSSIRNGNVKWWAHQACSMLIPDIDVVEHMQGGCTILTCILFLPIQNVPNFIWINFLISTSGWADSFWMFSIYNQISLSCHRRGALRWPRDLGWFSYQLCVNQGTLIAYE